MNLSKGEGDKKFWGGIVKEMGSNPFPNYVIAQQTHYRLGYDSEHCPLNN